MEHLDRKINGPDSSRLQDCFIKVKIVDFFPRSGLKLEKKIWQPKSIFLAFTISTEGDGRIVRVWKRDRWEYVWDFDFSEKEKSLLEFRGQIGSVLRWHFFSWSTWNAINKINNENLIGNYWAWKDLWIESATANIRY